MKKIKDKSKRVKVMLKFLVRKSGLY
jgi:hypothetical protein